MIPKCLLWRLAHNASLERSDSSPTVSASSESIDLVRSNASLWGGSNANRPEAETDRIIPEKLENEEGASQAAFAENSQIESDESELEESEEMYLRRRRRRRRRGRIMDKNIKLHGNVLRSRISNCRLELRCESVSEDVVDPRPTSRMLLRRAAHAGHRIHSTLGKTLSRLFRRNLVPVNILPRADRDIEIMTSQRDENSTQVVFENVSEESETQPMPLQESSSWEPITSDAIVPDIVQDDTEDLPTQAIEMHSHQADELSDVCVMGHTVEQP